MDELEEFLMKLRQAFDDLSEKKARRRRTRKRRKRKLGTECIEASECRRQTIGGYVNADDQNDGERSTKHIRNDGCSRQSVCFIQFQMHRLGETIKKTIFVF